MSESFGLADWLVVFALFALTTWIGGRMAGRQATLRDYFLGGKRLPWYAVSASIVATEISAVTYVSLPSVVARPGGDLTYLQIGLVGSLCAKALIAWLLVPAYFEREIYSPYDYMGERLGARARGLATAFFALGGVLGQSARVYLTALVLEVLLARELGWIEARTGLDPLVSAVAAIGLVAVAWTWMGGIATVVWTDLVLFLLFLTGAAVALAVAFASVPDGAAGAFRAAREAGKLRLLDLSTDPTRAYTLWAALIASSWGMVGSYGTDQLVAQRLFCCASVRDARRAILASYAAMVPTVLIGLVGIALFAHFRAHPLEGAARELVEADQDRLFPVFVLQSVPTGLKGLVVAGAFAAAISSLDSILAALSQTVLSAAYLPWRVRRGARLDDPSEERRTVRVSRALVILAAVLLCAVAVGIERVARSYGSVLDLALAMVGYTGGALIAGFFLAFTKRGGDGSGFLWSAPLSLLGVFAVTSHQRWAQELHVDPLVLCGACAGLGLAAWLALRVPHDLREGAPRRRVAFQTLVWAAGLALAVALARCGFFERTDAEGSATRVVLAWPWYLPLGSLLAFTWGALLARPARASEV